jgi:hypothetical protein
MVGAAGLEPKLNFVSVRIWLVSWGLARLKFCTKSTHLHQYALF